MSMTKTIDMKKSLNATSGFDNKSQHEALSPNNTKRNFGIREISKDKKKTKK